MSAARVAPDFEELYDRHREPLYRAMVLATDDRDLSLEGVDRGFARLSRRTLRRDHHPEAEVLRRASTYALKRTGSDVVRGFRLPDADVSPETQAIVAAARRLAPDRRIALIAALYLEWNDESVSAATGVVGTSDVVHDAIEAVTADVEMATDDARGAIARALRASGDSISRPLSRLESVRTESRTHKIGVAVAAAAVVLVAVGGTTLGVRALRSTTESDPQQVATGTAGTGAAIDPASSTTAAVVAIGDVEWVQSGLPFRQGDLSAATAGPDGFIAIGQDYTDPNGNGARLMISESGYDWTVLDSPLPRNGWIQTLVYEGDRYIGVGNQFDEIAGRDSPVVLVSDDGRSWETLSVPVEPSIEIDGLSLRVYTSVNTASVVGDELIVVGNQHAEEDLFQLIRESLPEDIPNTDNWGVSPGGIDFYDFQGNLVRTVPAEELGLSPELFALMSSGRTVAWRSTDRGVTWEETSIGSGFGPESYLGQLLAGDEVSLALVFGRFGGAIWSDADGEWAPLDLGRGVAANGLARFNGEFFVAGSTADGAAVWRSDDGITWQAIQSESFADLTVERLVASPHGLLAIGQAGQSQAIGPAVVETDDGFTVEIDSAGRYAVTDPDGNVVLELFGNEIQFGAEGGIVLANPDTGETIVTLDQRQIDLAWETVYRELESGGEFGGPQTATWAMLVSRDGDTWARVEGDAFGQDFYPNVAVLGADRILITGWQETGPEGGSVGVWVGELSPS
jgi:hypothetical protein